MCETLQAIQQFHSQPHQQNSGQENQQQFYPTANAMMQQCPPMAPQYAPAWQHLFANLTNQPQQYIGNRRKRKNNKRKRQLQQQQNQNQGQHPHFVNTNPNTRKYCWTHGACNHWRPDCWNKAEGHQDAATFQNKSGGSTKNCS
eukprot:7765088-Ditylum_brightwellii.AAC.1